MRDIVHGSSIEVAKERAKIATEGRGSEILAEQTKIGTWNSDDRFPEMVTLRTLYLLYQMGLEPVSEQAKRAIARVQKNVLWLMNISKEELPNDQDISWWHNPFFAGEVEPCINGRVVSVGAYFGINMKLLVEKLLGEQMEDGGWNCDLEVGSTRGSFHTTINVLEGLLEFERSNGKSRAVTKVRKSGEEYLLKRHLFKRLSKGKPIEKDRKGGPPWTQFSYPSGWRYDVLRGLDHLRNADGTWSLGIVHDEKPFAEPGAVEGAPSY